MVASLRHGIRGRRRIYQETVISPRRSSKRSPQGTSKECLAEQCPAMRAALCLVLRTSHFFSIAPLRFRAFSSREAQFSCHRHATGQHHGD